MVGEKPKYSWKHLKPYKRFLLPYWRGYQYIEPVVEVRASKVTRQHKAVISVLNGSGPNSIAELRKLLPRFIKQYKPYIYLVFPGKDKKFSRKQVLEIRALYDTGEYKHIQLAEKYKVDRSTISRLLRGETYKDV